MGFDHQATPRANVALSSVSDSPSDLGFDFARRALRIGSCDFICNASNICLCDCIPDPCGKDKRLGGCRDFFHDFLVHALPQNYVLVVSAIRRSVEDKTEIYELNYTSKILVIRKLCLCCRH
mgnify:CR=1 FL=1